MIPRREAALACILVLTISGCAKSREPVEAGFPDECMAVLSLFCISERMSAYSISIERKVQDIHATTYFIKANARDSGELLVLASVDSVMDETDTSAPADGCTLWGESIPDCEHWGRTLAYQTMMKGSPGAPHLNGVRQNIVAKKGVFKGEANVALPCQYLATGALRCAANLPHCEIEQDTVGCKVHVGNAR